MKSATLWAHAHLPATRWARWLGALGVVMASIATIATIAGCGGGVGVGGTGAYASGPITGFGSVIVNGIEFNDDSARIEDEDGALSSRSALRLGMLVEIDSGAVAGSGDALTAVATQVRFSSEIVGAVGSVNASAGTLQVFGQTVRVTATTVFDESFTGGLAGVAPGQVVEVYGFYDPSSGGLFTATRIEPRTGVIAFYKLRGAVQNLNRTAKTFSIGTQVFKYDDARQVGSAPAGLEDGAFVRVRVATTPTTTPVAGQWIVLAFGSALRNLPDLDRAKLRGLVTTFQSATRFSVNGQPVDASLAPAVSGLALGARVEVEGPVLAGVLRATRVELEDASGPLAGFKLKGAIGVHLPNPQLFSLRGVTVYYGAPGVQFENGSAATIATGVQAEVRGVLSAGGTRLLATRIKFGN